jgi:hypothetical protein
MNAFETEVSDPGLHAHLRQSISKQTRIPSHERSIRGPPENSRMLVLSCVKAFSASQVDRCLRRHLNNEEETL